MTEYTLNALAFLLILTLFFEISKWGEKHFFKVP